MIMKFYLCRLVNHILRAMETTNVTHLISVDLQKTFNCLARETLLEKIHLLAVFFQTILVPPLQFFSLL